MKIKIFYTVLSLVIIFFATLVARNGASTPVKIVNEKNNAKARGNGEKDLTDLGDPFKTKLFERELYDSNRIMAANEQIKELLDSMATTLNKLNDQVKELADKKLTILPAGMNIDQFEKITKMKEESNVNRAKISSVN